MDGERQDLRGRCRRHLCHQGRRDPQLQGDRGFTFGTSRCPPQFPLHPRKPIDTFRLGTVLTRPPCSVEKKVVMTVRVGVVGEISVYSNCQSTSVMAQLQLPAALTSDRTRSCMADLRQ